MKPITPRFPGAASRARHRAENENTEKVLVILHLHTPQNAEDTRHANTPAKAHRLKGAARAHTCMLLKWQ